MHQMQPIMNGTFRNLRRTSAWRAPCFLALCFMTLATSLRGAEARFFVPHVIDGGGLLGGVVTRLQTNIDVLNLGDQPHGEKTLR